MDISTGATASQKAIDTLKAVPAWLLVGISLSILVIWFVPTFSSSLPEEMRRWIPLAFVISVLLAACQMANGITSRILEHRRKSAERARQRLIHLYRPLAALFLTRHVTTSTGVGAPRLRHRVENAWIELGSYRHHRIALKRAIRALFDSQSSTSAEIEFGGDFPLREIVKLTRRYAEHADAALLNLISRADRSRYEEPDNGLMTDAEFALFDHIDSEHERLSHRFG